MSEVTPEQAAAILRKNASVFIDGLTEVRLRGVAIGEQASLFNGAADMIESQFRRITEIERKLDPRQWTKAESDAWHSALPNTVLAFEQLRKA